jgi:hypothetical protein
MNTLLPSGVVDGKGAFETHGCLEFQLMHGLRHYLAIGWNIRFRSNLKSSQASLLGGAKTAIIAAQHFYADYAFVLQLWPSQKPTSSLVYGTNNQKDYHDSDERVGLGVDDQVCLFFGLFLVFVENWIHELPQRQAHGKRGVQVHRDCLLVNNGTIFGILSQHLRNCRLMTTLNHQTNCLVIFR